MYNVLHNVFVSSNNFISYCGLKDNEGLYYLTEQDLNVFPAVIGILAAAVPIIHCMRAHLWRVHWFGIFGCYKRTTELLWVVHNKFSSLAILRLAFCVSQLHTQSVIKRQTSLVRSFLLREQIIAEEMASLLYTCCRAITSPRIVSHQYQLVSDCV